MLTQRVPGRAILASIAKERIAQRTLSNQGKAAWKRMLGRAIWEDTFLDLGYPDDALPQ